MSMKTKAPRWIFNEWWATGIPIGTLGGVSGTTLDLPVSVRTIGGVTPAILVGQQQVGVGTLGGATPLLTVGAQHVAVETIASITPMMIDGTLGVAVKTIGGATPTFTGGAQHMILTDASIQVDVTAAEITTLAGVTPTMIGAALGVAVRSIGGATPLLTIGAQHVAVETIASVTPMMIDGTLGIAVKTIGGATPALAVEDAPASTIGPQVMGRYASTTPAAVDDGDASLFLTDEYGRIRIWMDSKIDSVNDAIHVQLIGGATPMMVDGTLGVAVKTVGGATPLLSYGSQLVTRTAAIITATMTLTTASPYTAGNLAGTGGLLTFEGAARADGLQGEVMSMTLVDRGKKNIDFDLVLFGTWPASTTLADCTPFVVDASDLIGIAGVISVATIAYVDFADNSVAVDDNIRLVYDLSGTTTLFGALIPRTAATFGAADLSVNLGVQLF